MTDATNSLSLSQFYPQNLLIESVLVEDKEIRKCFKRRRSA